MLDTSVITRNEFSAVPAASAITRWQRSLRIGVGRSIEIEVSQNTQSLRDALAWGTGWGSYGEYGDGGRMVDIGDRLVVACSKERMDRIRKLLDVIASPAARTDTAELEEVTIIGARLTQTEEWMSPSQVASRAEALAGLLREVVAVSRPSAESSTWIFSFDGRILIRGSADTRRRCVEALRSVLSVAENGDRVETAGISILRLDKLPSALLVDGEWRVSHEELIELRDAIVQSIDADGWADSNGSADCMILPIGATMVIGGDAERRIRSIQLIDALLSTLRDGLARRLPVGRRTSESTTKPEHIAMWPIGQHLRVWRNSTKNDHEAGQAMLEDLQASSPELDDALNVRLSLFHDVLILSTTEPELIDRVEAALVQKALDTSP